MRLRLLSVSLFVTAAMTLVAQSPQAQKLEPKNAKPGTVLTISGVALGKTKVSEVFLTDHRFDMKVKVLEQTDDTLKIRVPPFMKPGRQQLLLLTEGKAPAYLEQPVYVLVEEDDKDKEKEVARNPQKDTQSTGAANSNGQPNNQ